MFVCVCFFACSFKNRCRNWKIRWREYVWCFTQFGAGVIWIRETSAGENCRLFTALVQALFNRFLIGVIRRAGISLREGVL